VSATRITWKATCDADGWTSGDAPNSADTCLFLVRTHLTAFHKETTANVTVVGLAESIVHKPLVEATEGIVSA